MKVIPLFKPIFLSAVSLGVFYILEYGFAFGFDLSSKLLKLGLLSGLTTVMFLKPDFKRYVLFLIGICLVLMILFNLLNFLSFSSIMGEFGFSLLIVTIFLYLPQIIKKGHIEKF